MHTPKLLFLIQGLVRLVAVGFAFAVLVAKLQKVHSAAVLSSVHLVVLGQISLTVR
jgi:hypothetical protein